MAAERRFLTARSGLGRTLAEAAAVGALSAVIGVGVNAARPNGLALVARTPYQTLVPCPEPGGPVDEVSASYPELRSPATFLVDARARDEFARAHLDGAVNLPYDWLEPVPEDELMRLASQIAGSGALRVVVYGDGGRPDSGEHLGKEISGRGIRNVCFVRGGAPALFEQEGG